MSKQKDICETDAAPQSILMQKRHYSVVKEASYSSSTDIIDLCSPVHTKPCRQSTPVIKSSSSYNATSPRGSSLFYDIDAAAPASFQQDEEDEYWEPAGYMDNLINPDAGQETPEPEEMATHVPTGDIFDTAQSFITDQLRSQRQAQPSLNDDDEVDENLDMNTEKGKEVLITSKEYSMARTHCDDGIIDLCSPASSKTSTLALPSNSTHISVLETQTARTNITGAKMLTEADPIELSSDEEDSSGDQDSNDHSYERLPVRTTSYGWIASVQSVLSVESSTQQSYASSSQYASSVALTHSSAQQQHSTFSMSSTTHSRSLFSMVSSGPTLSDYAAGTKESQGSGSSHAGAIAYKAPVTAAASSSSSSQAARGLHQLLFSVQQQVEEKQRLVQPQLQPQRASTTSNAATAQPTQPLTSSTSSADLAVPDGAVGATLQRSVSLAGASKPTKKAATKTATKDKVSKNTVPTTFAVPPSSATPASQSADPAVPQRAAPPPTVVRAPITAPKSVSGSAAAAVMPGIAVPPCLALPRKDKTQPSTAASSSGLGNAGASTGNRFGSAAGTGTGTGTGGGTTSAAEPPKFRSRFTEKTLTALPPLPAETRWEVLLLIDKRERSNALIQSSMSARNIPCQLATLAVGDFLWVARMRTSNGAGGGSAAPQVGAGLPGAANVAAPIASANNGNSDKGAADAQALLPDEDTQMSAVSDLGELGDLGDLGEEEIEDCDIFNTFVLDCIAERKSISDLASSMCDGRYNEQKNRLRACALRSTMYIIEGEHIVMSMHQKAISAAHIKTAMVSIHVDSGMHILRTRGMDHTIVCLQNLHRQVERRFQQHAQTSLYQTLAQFQAMYGKKGAATHRQLFGHQLRQIHGCSTSVALTLMSRYGTTARFMDELKMLGQTKAEYTLSNMVNEVTKRKLGPKLAQRLCQIYLAKF